MEQFNFILWSLAFGVALLLVAFPATFFIYCVRYAWGKAVKDSAKRNISFRNGPAAVSPIK